MSRPDKDIMNLSDSVSRDSITQTLVNDRTSSANAANSEDYYHMKKWQRNKTILIFITDNKNLLTQVSKLNTYGDVTVVCVFFASIRIGSSSCLVVVNHIR